MEVLELSWSFGVISSWKKEDEICIPILAILDFTLPSKWGITLSESFLQLKAVPSEKHKSCYYYQLGMSASVPRRDLGRGSLCLLLENSIKLGHRLKNGNQAGSEKLMTCKERLKYL